YGFTNTTGLACGPFPPITTASTISSQFCGPTNLVAPNAAQTFLFADSVHPTTAVQAINDGLLEGRAAPVGKLNVFASGNGGKFDIDSGTGNSGLNSDLSAAAV